MAKTATKRLPKQGDIRYIAEWLLEVKADDDGVLHPSEQDYQRKECDSIQAALDYANSHDLNNEGTVYVEEFSGYVWMVTERYNCVGEKVD
jgi:hypothetical protein